MTSVETSTFYKMRIDNFKPGCEAQEVEEKMGNFQGKKQDEGLDKQSISERGFRIPDTNGKSVGFLGKDKDTFGPDTAKCFALLSLADVDTNRVGSNATSRPCQDNVGLEPNIATSNLRERVGVISFLSSQKKMI